MVLWLIKKTQQFVLSAVPLVCAACFRSDCVSDLERHNPLAYGAWGAYSPAVRRGGPSRSELGSPAPTRDWAVKKMSTVGSAVNASWFLMSASGMPGSWQVKEITSYQPCFRGAPVPQPRPVIPPLLCSLLLCFSLLGLNTLRPPPEFLIQ